MVMVVRITGLMRISTPWIIESRLVMPFARSRLIKATRTMESFTTMPFNPTIPRTAIKDRGIPCRRKAKITPIRPNGIAIINYKR
ncbi:unnamed protein product, partial [marine sediment metagenome]